VSHQFHADRHALHGVTVVLETNGPATYVGRFDLEDERGVHLLNVGVHDGGGEAGSRDDYVRRSARFGVQVDRKHVVVPKDTVARITPLAEVQG
jgi:hypothetical protein